MIRLDEYRRLKEATEEARRTADQADGAYRQQLAQLKEEFGVETLEDAKRLLAKTKAQLDVSERDFNVALEEFGKKWTDLLSRGGSGEI